MKANRLLFFVCILLQTCAVKGWAQAGCDASVVIPEADRKYTNGNFDEVFQLLNPCLKTWLSSNAQVQGYQIVAMSYLALDSLPQAAAAVRSLLSANQNYEPEFSATTQFKELVAQQKELQERVIQITSVSKKAENLLQVPATVTVITQDDIIKRGYRDLTQMLNDLPGFDVIRGNGPSYVTFYQRGYRSTSNDRSILLIDGVEENDLNSDNIPISRQYALSDVERVEIIYGPASTMYGANAFQGVINVITKKFLDKHLPDGKRVAVTGSGQARYGSLNTKIFDGVVSARSRNIAVSATSRFFKSNEMDLSKYPEWNFDPRTAADYTTQQNVNGGVDAQKYMVDNQLSALFPNSNLYEVKRDAAGVVTGLGLTEAGKARAAELDNSTLFGADIKGSKVQFSDVSTNFFLRAKVEFKDFVVSFSNWKTNEGATPWYTNKSRIVTDDLSRWAANNKTFSITYNRFINDKVQILNLTSYRLHELLGATNLPTYRGYYNGSYKIIDLLNQKIPTYSIPYYYRVSNQLRNEFRILWTPLVKLDINSGLELRNSLIQANYITSMVENPSQTGRPDSTLAGGDNFRVYDLGVFSQGTYNWSDHLKIVLAGRMDYNQIRISGGYGVVFNPRASVIYSKGKFIFKAIYAEAFKDASYLQKYATTRDRLLNNPNLKPERVKNLEVSVYVKLNKSLSWITSGYLANYSNVVGLANTQTSEGVPTTQFQALGKQRIMGVQSEAKFVRKQWNIWGNVTLTSPYDLSKVEGERVRVSDVAGVKANIGGIWEVHKNLDISLTCNHIGARKSGLGTSGSSNPIPRFNPITILNTAITYKNFYKGFSLQLQAANLLNTEYFAPGIRTADGITAASRFPQERRTLSIGLLIDTN